MFRETKSLSILGLLTALLLPVAAGCATVTPIYSFQAGLKDGSYPSGELAFSGGKMFGTTFYGGGKACYNQGCGTVYALDLSAGTEKLLYKFRDNGDGRYPNGLSLRGDNLYGAVSSGGTSDTGTIFRINSASDKFTVLYSALYPYAIGGDIVPRHRDLYGFELYMQNGGVSGTFYDLDTASGVETNLYVFQGNAAGIGPSGTPLISGRFVYGSTKGGGKHNGGTLFRLDLASGDIKVLHNFDFSVEGSSSGYLVTADNSLYGTTDGGAGCHVFGQNCGTVFKYNLSARTWSRLATFDSVRNGAPSGSLLYSRGLLFGTTVGGGSGGSGTIYAVDPSTGSVTVLYNFTGGSDGGAPRQLGQNNGVIYGTTGVGGKFGFGTVFSFNPN